MPKYSAERKLVSDMLYNFGNNLSRIRKEKGISQRELARIMRMDHTIISNWEKCARYPTLDKVHDLAKVLGVSLHDLLDENYTD